MHLSFVLYLKYNNICIIVFYLYFCGVEFIFLRGKSIMISRELFISVLECVESQYRKDVGYGDRLREVFGFSDNVLYDNSDLVKSVLDLLRVYFPVDDKGFCEIEHWMFFLDFGKCGDDYESPGQLYDRLVLVWQNDILRKGYEVGILYPKPKNDRNF